MSRRACNNWKYSSWQATNSMAQHRQQTKQTPSLPVKTVYLFKLELKPRRYISRLLEAMEVSTQENVDQETPALCSPLVSIQIACSFLKEAYILIWRSNFYNCCKGTPPNHQIWSPADSSTGVPQDCKHFLNLKAAA